MVNTTRLSSTSWTVVADGACFLVMVIVHVGETCTATYICEISKGEFFFFFLLFSFFITVIIFLSKPKGT